MTGSNLEKESFNVDPKIMAMLKKDLKDENVDISFIIGGCKTYSQVDIILEIKNKTKIGKRFYESAKKMYAEYLD